MTRLTRSPEAAKTQRKRLSFEPRRSIGKTARNHWLTPVPGAQQEACLCGEFGYFTDMSTLQEIKAAIPKLTLEERAEVARCLHQWEDDEWDQQMKLDAAEGKLKNLLKKVDSDIAQGNLSNH